MDKGMLGHPFQGRVHEMLMSGNFCITTANVNIVRQKNAKIMLRKTALRVTTNNRKKLVF